jgi:hypothetical protein
MKGTLLRVLVAAFDTLTKIQSNRPILNIFAFKFSGYLCGTLTSWSVSARDMLPLTHFSNIFFGIIGG